MLEEHDLHTRSGRAPAGILADDGTARAIRVLHVHSGNIFGGIESMLISQLAAAAPPCHEYALCYPGRLMDALRDRGARCHELGRARFSDVARSWRARRRLGRILAARPPDVALVHGGWAQALFGDVIRAHVPLVRWAHAPLRGTDWIERLAWRHAPALTIFNSRFSRDASEGVQYGAAQIVTPCCLVEDAPPASIRDRIRSGLGASPKTVVFVHVGRLERWKGQQALVDAAGRLRRDKAWACWIVGGAADAAQRDFEAELRARAHDAGIGDRVRFLGERRDVRAVLAAADVYCQPNTAPEPYGLAVVEAMLAGLPVVASAAGGTLEIVPDRCGVLVPPGDVAAVSAALTALLEHEHDRRAIGARAAVHARALADPDAHARRLAQGIGGIVPSSRLPRS